MIVNLNPITKNGLHHISIQMFLQRNQENVMETNNFTRTLKYASFHSKNMS